jgi:hypothetical protein
MKKKEINNGRPQDTSESLLGDLGNKKPGRPLGSTSIERNPLITYQSYVHVNNTCYITSLLECLYSVFSYIWSSIDEMKNISDRFSKKSIYHSLVQHFQNRIATREGKNLKSYLTAGHRQIRNWVYENKIFPEGKYGNPIDVYNPFLRKARQSFQNLFAFQKLYTSICDNGT